MCTLHSVSYRRPSLLISEDGRGLGQMETLHDEYRIRAGRVDTITRVAEALSTEERLGHPGLTHAVDEVERTWPVMQETLEAASVMKAADRPPSIETPLRKLRTRRGDYLVPHFDLWKRRDDVAPIADILEPGSHICVVGSCFADQAVSYLQRRDYDAWSHPAGELYNVQSIRLEFEHVLGDVEWPDEIAVPTKSHFTHRFRKRCVAASVEALYELDARQTAEARIALEQADIVIVVAGTTTEVWRDAVTGLWANEIPDPSLFDLSRWRVDYGDLGGLRAEISRIQDLLTQATRAHQVFSVCPIPLYATWSTRQSLPRTAGARRFYGLHSTWSSTRTRSISTCGIGFRPRAAGGLRCSGTADTSDARGSIGSCYSQSSVSAHTFRPCRFATGSRLSASTPVPPPRI